MLTMAMAAEVETAQMAATAEMEGTVLMVEEAMEETGEIANMVEGETEAMAVMVLLEAGEVDQEERVPREMEITEEMDIQDRRK